MKKTIKIVLLFIICIILATTYVKAEDEACKITLSVDKTTVKPGDEVTITLLMENITKTTGIVELVGILDLPQDIFEIQTVEDQELATEIEGLGLDILYSGQKDTDPSIQNPWYLLLDKETGIYGLMGSTMADPQIESQIIGKIKLKVKESASNTTAKIALVDTEVSDAESLSGLTQPYPISNSEITLQINNVSSNPVEEPENPAANQTQEENRVQAQNNMQTQNKVQSENKATGSAPYTGVEDYIPFMFIGIIISLMAYINYKKYKDI